MNACVEAVVDIAKTWPTEDQVELLDALFGLVSSAGDELEAQWLNECDDRCVSIDGGDLVMAK